MKHTALICLWVLFRSGTVLTSDFHDEYPQIEISDGILNGAYLKTNNRRKICGFTGIPFAKPPIGELRFQAPVPNDPWTGERNATGVHAECPQRDVYSRSKVISGEEDCLYLNVYTPKLLDFEYDLLPVMFWIHGGGLLCGSGNIIPYHPSTLLDRDVVLVTTNYRIGPLGFFATGDDVVPGNNGLKDQNLALQWAKKNIQKFGGDPDRITLFGGSAGGTSVSFQMISPLSNGLFNKAIIQSGTSMCPWGLSENDETIKNSFKLGKALNCPTESSQDMVECLRKVDARTFIELDDIFKLWDYDPMIPFKPIIEPKSTKNPFLPDHPLNIIKSGKSVDVPVIIGVTSQDGALKTSGYINENLLDEFAEKFDEILPVSLFYNRTEKDYQKMTDKIKKFYFSGKKIQDSIKVVTDLYSDGWFFKCADDLARLYTKYYKQPVYFYKFGYRGSSSLSKFFGGGDVDYGTVHGDELMYLFPFDKTVFPDEPPTENDRKMSKIMRTLWTNFAYTGNPTPKTSKLVPVKWLPYTLANEDYFHIDNDGLSMQSQFFKDRAEFWRSLNDPLLETAKQIREEL
ncbi:unnamed protein product [Phyllotreta striolata]|uniref:Carboxylic ester hydrolase n=1 Tax=Phyllotreta striolata TaxID=444603 RepID=A0A9N9XPC7_PHYSR|nr:unnamed protein product [Phyllotreta striolata]